MTEAQDVPVEVGDLVAGKYRVERVLGSGGMGIVVAATHITLNEMRAIKLMRPKLANNAAYSDRFIQEAQAIARLKSEHVAKVHDVGTHDGIPYMVIEYVDGIDFAGLLRERAPLPAEEAVGYVLQICEALAEAHKNGIVHRDIKPANLFLSKSNDGSACVRVIDFGIAKTAADLTLVGVVLGSPRYMPPEQIRATREVDARADIWAVGVVLYELLTGTTPFDASSVLDICEQILRDDPAPPSSVSARGDPALDAVVLSCLEKDRDRRYATVADLASALAPFASAESKALAERVARVLGQMSSSRSASAPPPASFADADTEPVRSRASLPLPSAPPAGSVTETAERPGPAPSDLPRSPGPPSSSGHAARSKRTIAVTAALAILCVGGIAAIAAAWPRESGGATSKTKSMAPEGAPATSANARLSASATGNSSSVTAASSPDVSPSTSSAVSPAEDAPSASVHHAASSPQVRRTGPSPSKQVRPTATALTTSRSKI